MECAAAANVSAKDGIEGFVEMADIPSPSSATLPFDMVGKSTSSKTLLAITRSDRSTTEGMKCQHMPLMEEQKR